MATASIPAPSSTRKRKPDPARVVQSYYHEVSQRGRRGAYRRTGDLYNISDETVRRFVHAAEERANTPPLSDELAYVPPPFSDELAVIRAKSAVERATEGRRRDISNMLTPQPAPRLTPAECGSITSNSRSTVAFAPHFQDATRHAAELSDWPTDTPQSPQASDEPGHARPDIDNPGAEAPELPPEAFPNPEPNQPNERSELPHHDRPLGPSDSPTTDRQSVPDWPTSSPTDRRHYTAEHPRPVPVPPGPPEPEPNPNPDPAPMPTPPLYRPQRVIVRVSEQRQVSGLVGWLSTNPMLGPVPVWALLLLGFGALLVQLGLLG